VVITADVQGRVNARDIPGPIVALAALTFSPALLIYSTQPLKDPLCLLFVISAICGARLLWPARTQERRRGAGAVGGGVGLITMGVYGLAGIRAYVCIFILVAIVAAATHNVIAAASKEQRLRDAFRDGALVAWLWIAFVAGAGPYAWPYESAILSFVGLPSIAMKSLDSARSGFASSGGATTLAGEEPVDESTTFALSGAGRIGRLLRGLAVFFVPVTALAAASIVRFSGGQGLLGITDLDTVAIDFTIASAVALLLSHKRDPPGSAITFALVLGLLLTASMAYVVTNYGTLFRLRIMAVAPFWIVPTMVSRRGAHGEGDLPIASRSPTSS
jgi:hypothetical protein